MGCNQVVEQKKITRDLLSMLGPAISVPVLSVNYLSTIPCLLLGQKQAAKEWYGELTAQQVSVCLAEIPEPVSRSSAG